MKAGVVEEVKVVVAMQRYSKHVSAATGTDATAEDVMFSAHSASTVYDGPAAVTWMP